MRRILSRLPVLVKSERTLSLLPVRLNSGWIYKQMNLKDKSHIMIILIKPPTFSDFTDFLCYINPEAAIQGCSHKKVFWKYVEQIYRRTIMPKCDFNKVTKQLFWNRPSTWVFSCKFTAYFQKKFFKNTSGGLLLKITHISPIYLVFQSHFTTLVFYVTITYWLRF